MCLARGGVGGGGGEWVTGLGWALPILEEHGESGICVCVLVAVVWVVLGESGWADWARVLEGVLSCIVYMYILLCSSDHIQ